MKNIRQTKVILEATLVLTKILELLHWIGAASMLVFGVFAIVTRQGEHDALEKLISECGKELSCYGFEMSVADSSGAVNMSAILLFAIAAIMIFSLDGNDFSQYLFNCEEIQEQYAVSSRQYSDAERDWNFFHIRSDWRLNDEHNCSYRSRS